MLKYTLKRILYMIPVLIGISVLVFFILQLAPGDVTHLILGEDQSVEAVEQLREELGLNDPVSVQYLHYMAKLVRGDFGTSYMTNTPVWDELAARFPYTFKLAAAAAVVSIVLAIPLGILAAVKQNTLFDHLSMVVSLVGISMPAFWLALVLVMQFSLKLGWFPVQGAEAGWRSYVLPAVTIGFMNMAAIARTTRSSMLETLRQDYVRTARAKGVNEYRIITHHAFRNAMLPTVTVIGMQIGALLGGAVLTETVFAWPGIGRFLVQSISSRDIPCVMGCVLVLSFLGAVVTLITDLTYGIIDPRVRTMYR